MKKIILVVLFFLLFFNLTGCTYRPECQNAAMGWTIIKQGTTNITVFTQFDDLNKRSHQADYSVAQRPRYSYRGCYPPSSWSYFLRLKDIPYEIEVESNPEKVTRVIIRNTDCVYEYFADNESYQGSCKVIDFVSSASRPEEFQEFDLSDKDKSDLLEAGRLIVLHFSR